MSRNMLFILLTFCLQLSIIFAASAEVPEGFIFLGKEGETVYLNEKSTVAYGGNESFTYKYNIQGRIEISNGFFGNDPAPGVVKSAYYKPNNGQADVEEVEIETINVNRNYPGYTYLGKTGDSVFVPDNSTLIFGKNSVFRPHLNIQGEFILTNQLFWGHKTNDVFYCFYKKNDGNNREIINKKNENYPPGPEGYTYLGSEDDAVFVPQLSDLAYGANGKYSYISNMKGPIEINNGLFGDPVPGIRKHCYYKVVQQKPIPDFENSSLYSAERVNSALEQALSSGYFENFYDLATAWINQKFKNTRLTAINNKLLNDGEFSRILALRQFVHQTGVENIAHFAGTDDRRNFLKWILTSPEILELYLLGGKPLIINPGKDTPGKSLAIWYEIYKKDPQSTKGVYLKLAIATALALNSPMKPYSNNTEHHKQVGYVDPIVRYFHYKNAHHNGELFPDFDALSVWEYRFVVTAWATEEDIAWARQMIRTMRPEILNQSRIHEASGLMQYSGNLSPVTNYRELLEIGGVCGAISFLGSLSNQAFGIPAFTVGQPAHAAFVFRHRDNTWAVSNDIWTWRYSYATFIQGLETTGRSDNPLTYHLLQVEARSKPELFKKTEQLRWIAYALYYLEERQAVRSAGIKLNPLNFMLWNETFAEYKQEDEIDGATWNRLFEEYTHTFKNFPDQLADFFININRPDILGRMDTSLFTRYGDGVYAAMEKDPSSQYRDKFKAIWEVILNKVEIEVDYLLPRQLTATDTAHQEGQSASNLIDRRIGERTNWYTNHDLSMPLPQSVTITFDDTYRIDRIVYWPRQEGGTEGNILSYELYGSTDGTNFFQLASGNWKNDHNSKTVKLNAPALSAIRLVALEGIGGFAAGDEIRIYKKVNSNFFKRPFYTETGYFDKPIQNESEVLTGKADLLYPDPPQSIVIEADRITNPEGKSILQGYSGEKQVNIYNKGTMIFNVNTQAAGRYSLSIVYATPYTTGIMKISGKEYEVPGSYGLWKKSNPLSINLDSGNNTLSLDFENVPHVTINRIIITKE